MIDSVAQAGEATLTYPGRVDLVNLGPNYYVKKGEDLIMETIVNIIKEVFIALWGVPYAPETVIVAITLATVELAKKKGMKKAAAPVLSVVVAILLSMLNALIAGTPWAKAIAPGFVIGLTTSGSFSYIKALARSRDKLGGPQDNLPAT